MPKRITKNLIDNSKTIHELGGRFEVERGDWFVQLTLLDWSLPTLVDFDWDEPERDSVIPIWEARHCKAWLRERGYLVNITDYTSTEQGIEVEICKANYDWLSDFTESTEDEACTEAVIKISREEKND